MNFLPNFSAIKNKGCMLVHYSTSSQIELVVFKGDPEDSEQHVWFDYTQMGDLIDLINSVQVPHMPTKTFVLEAAKKDPLI